MVYNDQDTIAAVATARGASGVGIVRISGRQAYQIARSVTRKDLKARHACYTSFVSIEKNSHIDQGIAIYFKGPASFTGEDVVELQGHGGQAVQDLLLQEVVSAGARIAQPGEFSFRAFLNGKMDLTQVEATADLINAGTEQAARAALRSLSGSFSEKINNVLESLISLRTFVEAALDFSEEEIDLLTEDNLVDKLQTVTDNTEKCLSLAKKGAVIAGGANLCIVGEPNAGKSSLLNALSGQKTAIVAEIPGTTRDLVRERINVAGMTLNFVDTAGLRFTDDVCAIEREGINRAIEAYENADIVILLLDARKLLENTVDNYVDNFFKKGMPKGQLIVCANKSDLLNNDLYTQKPSTKFVTISAKTGLGLDKLLEEIKNILGMGETVADVPTARVRHVDALLRALDHLGLAKKLLSSGRGSELLAEELRLSQENLSEITGKYTTDDLLGEIFSSFCIGK